MVKAVKAFILCFKILAFVHFIIQPRIDELFNFLQLLVEVSLKKVKKPRGKHLYAFLMPMMMMSRHMCRYSVL